MSDAESIRLRLVGQRPLLMHCARLADPLDPINIELGKVTRKRDKTEADYEEIAKIEWFGGLWLDGSRPCIPAEALQANFIGGARTKRKGRLAEAGHFVDDPALLKYDGPSDLNELWKDKQFRYRAGVRVNNARTMRTRPRFPEWSVELTAKFFPSLLSRSDVIEIYKIGGFREGLGDWRPTWGRFAVELIE
jgi:hypothetical protein